MMISRANLMLVRKFLLCLIVSLLIFSGAAFLGCIGGGSGGPGAGYSGTAEDEALITSQVQAFLKAATEGDNRVLRELFSSRMQGLTGSDSDIAAFTVFDFGKDIANPADNASYTFFIDSSNISYLGDAVAKVPTWTHFPEAQKFHLSFNLSETVESG
ncbi:MAG: hypothetical protein PHD82_13700 [Candidatus Riflebacteria bacterium]|nr:hypothetical protein [Candidatus Riflebacteria bacterium]